MLIDLIKDYLVIVVSSRKTQKFGKIKTKFEQNPQNSKKSRIFFFSNKKRLKKLSYDRLYKTALLNLPM
jgi:hypothetical protein